MRNDIAVRQLLDDLNELTGLNLNDIILYGGGQRTIAPTYRIVNDMQYSSTFRICCQRMHTIHYFHNIGKHRIKLEA